MLRRLQPLVSHSCLPLKVFVLLLIPFATCPPLTAITFAQKKLEKHVQDIFMYDESIRDTSVKADPSESEFES
jgi:hypothetical protein